MGNFSIDLMNNYTAIVDITEILSSFGYQLLSPLSSTPVTPQ